MYRIRYLAGTMESLCATRDHIAQENLHAAEKTLDIIQAHIAALKETPYMYALYDDIPVYTRIIVSSYLIFYTVDEKKRLVEVHRVLYGARNTAHTLNKSKEMQ